MSNTILKVENLSKQYRLGLVGTGTISDDLKRTWYKLRGKEDPFLKVGDLNDRAAKSDSKYIWALKDINFELNNGEVLGIIGKNGAGKSTLLKILSKVTSPTTGSIKSWGRIASLLEVGTGFHPELTGRENIFLNGAIMGMTKSEVRSKLDEIIDFSGTEKYIDTPVKRYSSGMRVRLGFAVAAHLEPEILIVDEVLAVGDAEFQKKAIGKMQDVTSSEGRTVLFVSHNMASISNLCPRSILINNGLLLNDGPTDDIIKEYLSFYKTYGYEPNTSKVCYIESAEILNSHQEKINALDPGEVFFVDFTIKSKVNIGRVVISLRFETELGIKVANIKSNDTSHSVKVTAGINQFRTKIIPPKLLANSYKVTIGLLQSNGGRIDLAEAVTGLKINQIDISGYGKTRQTGEIVYMESEWGL